MRFWDSSAIAPLLLTERRSFAVHQLLSGDASVIAAAITPVEVASLLWRRRHRGELTLAGHERAERRYAQMSRRWDEVALTREITDLARDLLGRHVLRSLDAIQLASAIWASSTERKLPFVTLDEKLAIAARAEGFPILP